MKIVVLNGSPKGKLSFTLQYVQYVKQFHPQHEWVIIDVAKKIKKIEKRDTEFQAVIEEIKSADGVLWSFGLYVLCVPSQYMRFIELISEKKVKDAFKGKYTGIISSSIHYYDHTAHQYLRAECEDLEMKFIDGISVYLNDYRLKEIRHLLRIFMENYLNVIENQETTTKLYSPLQFSDFNYQPSVPDQRIDKTDKKIVVITDEYNPSNNLGKMIDRFNQSYSNDIEIINLNDVEIKGGCLGCMRCGYDYTCFYDDEFKDVYNNRIMPADIIIFAGTMKSRYLSAKWKQFYDRSFFWNHTPTLVGKQIGYLISGPLSQNHNLIEILEASATTRQDANFAGIITDEIADSGTLDQQLQSFAGQILYFSEREYTRPQNFLGVGGHKVFRDEIWGPIRMIWQADHRYFRKHGKYDFPQKRYFIRIGNFFMLLLCKIPPFRKKFYNNLKSMPAKRMKSSLDKAALKEISTVDAS
jgi:multimeric flavodoxin WrbA